MMPYVLAAGLPPSLVRYAGPNAGQLRKWRRNAIKWWSDFWVDPEHDLPPSELEEELGWQDKYNYCDAGENELDEEDILDYLNDQHAKAAASKLPRGGALSAIRSVKSEAHCQLGRTDDSSDSDQKEYLGVQIGENVVAGGRLSSCPSMLGRSGSNLGLLTSRLLSNSKGFWSRNTSMGRRQHMFSKLSHPSFVTEDVNSESAPGAFLQRPVSGKQGIVTGKGPVGEGTVFLQPLRRDHDDVSSECYSPKSSASSFAVRSVGSLYGGRGSFKAISGVFSPVPKNKMSGAMGIAAHDAFFKVCNEDDQQLDALAYKAALDMGLNNDLLMHFGISPRSFWGDMDGQGDVVLKLSSTEHHTPEMAE
ncbi:hypothetical protein CEUSTIGMA_g9240.t1 [Chlamydomonas eustigma]|uniref:Uncharacterized protein n=1 Tax=Chlamydomonas eustigma TaxID=1157962 RepID=A0A250XFX0_9CHLO|nr:hypothetical protein CEUSTIGMA_g9240.t1 [Chlamydomonas eustigma]|eukprot:GAX81812.1 hypothetical protein CEUSTIGMA_g9240.t1 [Chlamydomonas eustigma]